MLSLPIGETEDMLIDYILYLNKQDLSSGYIGVNFCALKHFYSMNDVRLNTVKIGKFLGESKKKNVDRSYTCPEIKTILDICDVRMKTVVSILASTGMRRGALPLLKLSHLEQKDVGQNQKVYKFTIYENTSEQYFTFCSPETTNHIDAYLDYRTRSGEKLTKDAYLIREQFDINDLEQVRKQGRPISKKTLSNLLISLTVKAGLRKVNHNFTKRERESVPVAHGFRKFFTTQLVNSKVNPEIREMLLGHSIGLAGAYYKPTEDEMLEEFMKAADNLTINEENRLKKKVIVLQKRNDNLDRLLDRIDKLEREIGIKI
jgi:integrase